MKSVPGYTDPELVNLLKQKDQDACTFLYEKYAGALYGLIEQIIPGTQTVNELLADSFITIINSIEKYDPSGGRLFTWMMQLTRQAAIDKLKSGPRPVSFEPGLLQKDRSGIGGLISKLHREEQQVINLAYLKGYSVEEVAGKLGIPVEIVKAKMSKGLIAINSPY